jgi:hypothetical protein
MTTELVASEPDPLTANAAGLAVLRQMILKSVDSEHPWRNYAKALEELFAFNEERRQPPGQFCNGPLQN